MFRPQEAVCLLFYLASSFHKAPGLWNIREAQITVDNQMFRQFNKHYILMIYFMNECVFFKFRQYAKIRLKRYR